MSKKAIFFDLDDTLFDVKKSIHNAIGEFKESFEELKSYSTDDLFKVWEQIEAEQYKRYLGGEIDFSTLKTERIKHFFKYYDIELDEESSKTIADQYYNAYQRNWTLFEETTEVLENLRKDYSLAILSNGDSTQQRKKLAVTGLEKYFDNVFISGEVGINKPNKEIFEYACNKMNIDPKNGIMVGDNFNADIKGSSAVGMKSIWINIKNEEREYENKVSRLYEVINMI